MALYIILTHINLAHISNTILIKDESKTCWLH